MLDDLKGLLKINSVSISSNVEEEPFGKGVKEALCYTLELCEKYGFKTKNYKNLYGYAEIGSGEKLIGILVHLDVVPAEKGWDVEPFDLTEKDGKLYGRGVTDDKGPVIACIHAMKELLESGIELKNRIRIIFGCSEENGDWRDIEEYKKNEEIPGIGFTPDADFPVVYGEKGLLGLKLILNKNLSDEIEIKGGTAINMVPDFATYKISRNNGSTITVEEIGKSAHGSTPEDGENAITKLLEKTNTVLGKEYMQYIGHGINGELLGCYFEDEESGKTTVNVGLIYSDENNINIELDVRLPITISKEVAVKSIMDKLKDSNFKIEVMDWEAPICLDKNGELVKTLMEAYKEMTGDNTEPMTMGGGTYARAMDNIVAFGPMLPGRELTEHQANEYMLKEDFYKIKDIYVTALKKLS